MNRIVIGNLKMNIFSAAERERYLDNFKKEIVGKKLKKTEIILCPPYIHIENFRKSLGKKIAIGGQNMFWKKEGSFTGEISGTMLKNFGCECVILGHSERRKYFCETNEDVNLKVVEALKIGLRPIICVGETRVERDLGETHNVIAKQVEEALKEVNRTKAENIIIAYEPVWSVGSDQIPTTHEIMEARLLIKKILVSLFEKKYAENVRIVYGGSVNAKTVNAVCIDSGMDGVLVGRESLAPFEFIKIAEILSK